jgi:hypothetical protein
MIDISIMVYTFLANGNVRNITPYLAPCSAAIMASNTNTVRQRRSHQLVRRLLKATEDPIILGDQRKDVGSSSSSRQEVGAKRKRKGDSVSSRTSNLDEEQIVRWHAQTLLAADQKMQEKSAVVERSRQKLVASMEINSSTDSQRKKARVTVGASRTPATDMMALHEPTFNKKRHAQERELKKMQKLKDALKTLQQQKKKRRKQK